MQSNMAEESTVYVVWSLDGSHWISTLKVNLCNLIEITKKKIYIYNLVDKMEEFKNY